MINKQRVQRIRNIIYTILVLIIFVPFLLVIVLSFRLIGLLTNVSAYFEVNPPSVSEQAPEQSDSGYVIPPVEQSLAGEINGKPEPGDEPAGDAAGQGNDAATDNGEYVKNTYSPASYPSLYFETLPVFQPAGVQAVYLTFDNTPASQADGILSVLSKHDVKATFFVWWNETLGDGNGSFYQNITADGHSIGIHAASMEDSYSTIYSSIDYFLETYARIFNAIYAETGVKTRLYRLPGGSVSPQNPSRQAALTGIKAELDSRGFLQYDWNASGEDAVVPALSKDQILRNMKNSLGSDGNLVVLLHDGTGSDSTTQALDAFISEYKAAGYSFETLSADTKPVSFLDK